MFETPDKLESTEKKDFGPKLDLQETGILKRLLVFSVKEYREAAFKDKKTGADRDAVIVDITVVDTGEAYESQMVSAGSLIAKLKGSVGKMVLARLHFGPIPGNTEGHKRYTLANPTPEDVEAATKLILSQQAADPFAL